MDLSSEQYVLPRLLQSMNLLLLALQSDMNLDLFCKNQQFIGEESSLVR